MIELYTIKVSWENTMSLRQSQAIFMLNVAKLIVKMNSEGFTCTFGEAFRTPEQAEIYAKSGKGIKNSLHCKRLAIDINLFSPKGDYLTTVKDHEQFGMFWETLHPKNRWLGRFAKGDANHYEMTE